MNSSNHFKINKADVVYEMFDDEVIIINLDSGNYYSFGQSGTDMWRLIESDLAFGEMVKWLRDNCEEDGPGIIESVLKESLEELEREGLIVLDESQKSSTEKRLDSPAIIKPRTDKIVFEKPILEKHSDMQDFLLVDPIHEIDYTEWPK
jgi:hypothetical protein